MSLGPARDLGNSGRGKSAKKKSVRKKAAKKRAVKKPGGVALKKHLQHLRVAELRDVNAFWTGVETSNGTKRDLVDGLERLMTEEGTVYRRVRTLTRKVLDVLLLLLRRDRFASDLPGLFQRLPGEEGVELEYHEAEAGLRALFRRGFLAEVSDKSMAGRGANGNGRVIFTVPEELGTTLTGLFREETRTIGSVMSLRQHLETITATEREALRGNFPQLGSRAALGDAQAMLGSDGAPGLLARLDDDMRKVAEYAIERHCGVVRRAQWSRRRVLKDIRWDRKGWSKALEAAGVGTVAHVQLSEYGIACDDDALVIFEEVQEDWRSRTAPEDLGSAETLRPGCDLVADLCAFLEHVRRTPVRVSRGGEVYKAGRRKLQAGFIFRETFLAGPAEIWNEVYGAAEHMALIQTDDESFLELRPEAEGFLLQPLEEKVRDLYRLALEQAGPRGRSLHQHEMRTIVADVLREEPERWFFGSSLAALARHRYLATLDERGIKDRHRDRFFSAYFSGTETPEDLLQELDKHWLRRLFVLGFLEVAAREDEVVAWKLSAVGARVLGAEVAELETGLQPLLVNPDYEVLVLPEGDVTDVIHTLDGFAQRVKTEDVVHFRLTKESIEAAAGAGRSVEEFTQFLEARARGGVPQNVLYSINSWAGSVTFATLERGVLLRTSDDVALELILTFPEVKALVIRRLGEGEVLLKDAPTDRKLLAALRERGIELQGP